ncbi:MAG: hypothetical protein ACRERC_04490 [Candidatus Binatia bacterium]
MRGRNRTFLLVGVVLLLAGWLAWKVLLTQSKLPTPPPVAQETVP